MKKVLITGGAGYIGSRLVEHLLDLEAYEIVVIDNLMFDQTSLVQFSNNPNFKFVFGNVTNTTLLFEWLRWADICIPLACFVGMPICSKQSSKEVWAVNHDQIKHIADFIHREHSEIKVIFPNSNSGYGISDVSDELQHCTEETPLRPISLYGQTKVFAENLLLKRVPDNCVCFRLATVFGTSPRMRLDLLVNDFVWQAVRNKSITLFESHFKRNFIHIQDVVRAFVFAIENFDKMKGQTFNAGLSSANLSKLELCEQIKKYVPDLNIFHAQIGEDPDKRNYIVSNEKLESLGWQPQYDLDFGIRELMEAYEILKNVRGAWSNV